MRETRPYGSEGGATEPNRSSLPLSERDAGSVGHGTRRWQRRLRAISAGDWQRLG